MSILDLYREPGTQDELRQLLTLASQKHPDGLPDFFLEKDLWVTEILRLLFDEGLLGQHHVAFKGGTALSKCWKVIDRFSEDIDLSIHWADLAGVDDEAAAWVASTKSGKQKKKFRQQQEAKLAEWSTDLVEVLNQRLARYDIDGLGASLEADSKGEKVNIQYPAVTTSASQYHLDYVLLEFGGRNRGQPTEAHTISTYVADVPELESVLTPRGTVQAYDPSYILWEKLTALHQYSTMEREPNTHRVARHWYDVDCLLRKHFAEPLGNTQAMHDVVAMKQQRWSETGVDYTDALRGKLQLVPSGDRLRKIADDHREAIEGRMFYVNRQPDSFEEIIARIAQAQNDINAAIVAT